MEIGWRGKLRWSWVVVGWPWERRHLRPVHHMDEGMVGQRLDYDEEGLVERACATMRRMESDSMPAWVEAMVVES